MKTIKAKARLYASKIEGPIFSTLNEKAKSVYKGMYEDIVKAKSLKDALFAFEKLINIFQDFIDPYCQTEYGNKYADSDKKFCEELTSSIMACKKCIETIEKEAIYMPDATYLKNYMFDYIVKAATKFIVNNDFVAGGIDMYVPYEEDVAKDKRIIMNKPVW